MQKERRGGGKRAKSISVWEHQYADNGAGVITSFAARPESGAKLYMAEQSGPLPETKILFISLNVVEHWRIHVLRKRGNAQKSHAIRFLTMAAAARQTCDKKWTDAAPFSADQRSAKHIHPNPLLLLHIYVHTVSHFHLQPKLFFLIEVGQFPYFAKYFF